MAARRLPTFALTWLSIPMSRINAVPPGENGIQMVQMICVFLAGRVLSVVVVVVFGRVFLTFFEHSADLLDA